MIPKSENVLNACGFCGGGPGGIVRRTGPGSHSEWCVVVNPAIAQRIAARWGLPYKRSWR